MLAKIMSCAIVGLNAEPVTVEVDVQQRSFPGFAIVGLPDAAVRESRDRVYAAIRNSDLKYPGDKRITINLAPADIRKEGPVYDLPLAVGLLAASRQIWFDALDDALFLGELSLDGTTRHTKGVLLLAALARDLGRRRVYVPAVNADEAAMIPDIEVVPVTDLSSLVSHLTGLNQLPTKPGGAIPATPPPATTTDFADIMGQEHVKRALEIAAAGAHNILLSGPPGTGKTLMAKALSGILPPLSVEEALEVTKVYSVAGLLPNDEPLIRQRPFRAPHHTISYAGLVGGGAWPRPGEVSLAHHGVLFLDELPEFADRMLDLLRQPLEGIPRQVAISRASGTVTFPANFMLVAAQNPCPCGYDGDPVHDCSCSEKMILRYRKRISGPLLDRIDMHITVPRINFNKLTATQRAEPSAAIRDRVHTAHQQQLTRFTQAPHLHANAAMGPSDVRLHCQLDNDCRQLMKQAMSQLNLSARAFHRVLKVARTIADLAHAPQVTTPHLAEALQYRPRTLP
ncbi:MAG TPA: YifB family Mg chelatase-like AAA ATPase [Anaerolineae bacterium]|nr:YifB family Mg chelatase-like AAA ATPase [Anaerolineae bacterium]